MELAARSATLHLADTFRIARLTVDSMGTCVVRLRHDGVVGHGEGSLGPTGDTVDDLVRALEVDGLALLGGGGGRGPGGRGLLDPGPVLERIARWPGPAGARMALDGAVHDWFGRRVGAPLWRLLGGTRVLARATGYTLGIASVEETQARVDRAPGVGAFKVKVGGPGDLDRIEAVRRRTSLPLRVDGNEGWTFEVARRLTPRLVELGVVLLEQPFPAAAVDDHHRYRSLPGRLPLYVDEGCRDVAGVERVADHADGVVVKLAKSGGIHATREVVAAARARGLGLMLSCMCESQLGIAQAALLAPLVDHVDLDSHLMLRNTPFTGLGLEGGHIVQSAGPGLGLQASTSTATDDPGG